MICSPLLTYPRVYNESGLILGTLLILIAGYLSNYSL